MIYTWKQEIIFDQVHDAVSRQQNAEQNHNLLNANKSSGNVAQFKYLGITNLHSQRKN
jgi:hypothetical protein